MKVEECRTADDFERLYEERGYTPEQLGRITERLVRGDPIEEVLAE